MNNTNYNIVIINEYFCNISYELLLYLKVMQKYIPGYYIQNIRSIIIVYKNVVIMQLYTSIYDNNKLSMYQNGL